MAETGKMTAITPIRVTHVQNDKENNATPNTDRRYLRFVRYIFNFKSDQNYYQSLCLRGNLLAKLTFILLNCVLVCLLGWLIITFLHSLLAKHELKLFI